MPANVSDAGASSVSSTSRTASSATSTTTCWQHDRSLWMMPLGSAEGSSRTSQPAWPLRRSPPPPRSSVHASVHCSTISPTVTVSVPVVTSRSTPSRNSAAVITLASLLARGARVACVVVTGSSSELTLVRFQYAAINRHLDNVINRVAALREAGRAQLLGIVVHLVGEPPVALEARRRGDGRIERQALLARSLARRGRRLELLPPDLFQVRKQDALLLLGDLLFEQVADHTAELRDRRPLAHRGQHAYRHRLPVVIKIDHQLGQVELQLAPAQHLLIVFVQPQQCQAGVDHLGLDPGVLVNLLHAPAVLVDRALKALRLVDRVGVFALVVLHQHCREGLRVVERPDNHLQQPTLGDIPGQFLQLLLVEHRAIVQAGVDQRDWDLDDLFLGALRLAPRGRRHLRGHAASLSASAIATALSCRQRLVAGTTCLTSPPTTTP